MNDTVQNPIEGYFKIETIKNGKVVDTFEDKNQIMFDSKVIMLSAITGSKYPGGISGSANPSDFYINTFVLGTQGHSGSDFMIPQDIDYKEHGLTSALAESDPKPYPITFNAVECSSMGIGGPPNLVTTELEDYHNKTSSGLSGADVLSTVKMVLEEPSDRRSVVYVFELPNEAGLTSGIGPNPGFSGNPVAYTEAALYTKINQTLNESNNNLPEYGYIFAKRTFPAKIKDSATTFRITWRIIF